FTGSLVVISVIAVLRTIRSVCAAMAASSVVGDEEKNGGLWCSPIAKTSRPTSSARRAIRTIASMRSASLGVRPVTGFRVMSLTEKIPNCIPDRLVACADNYSKYITAHVFRAEGMQARCRTRDAYRVDRCRGAGPGGEPPTVAQRPQPVQRFALEPTAGRPRRPRRPAASSRAGESRSVVDDDLVLDGPDPGRG